MTEYLKAWEAANMIHKLERENRDLRIEKAILESTPFRLIYNLFLKAQMFTATAGKHIVITTLVKITDEYDDENYVRKTIIDTKDLTEQQIMRMFYQLKDTPVHDIKMIGSYLYISLCPDDRVKRFSDLFCGTHYRKRKVRDFLIYHNRVWPERHLNILDSNCCNYKTGMLEFEFEGSQVYCNIWSHMPLLTDNRVKPFLDKVVKVSNVITDDENNVLELTI